MEYTASPIRKIDGHLSAQAPSEEPQAWLAPFEPRSRSLVANMFCAVVRAGEPTPERVLAVVQAECARRMERGNPSQAATMELLASLVADDRGAALAYAASILAWEHLPRLERERLKRERGERYRRAYMASLPATDKQLVYLEQLGYAGPAPANCADASEAIDVLLRSEEVR